MAFASYVAACAEVSVDGNNVKVHRIVAATDPGYAVNPAQIERQVAGSLTLVASKLQSAGIVRCRRGKVRVLDSCKAREGRVPLLRPHAADAPRLGI
jgi:CO/xanthine dehydrogenase Mo-binding subunit